MRRIVAAEYLSLDGVTEDPGSPGEFKYRGWTKPYWNDELAEHQSELLFASDALLLGRVTYNEFVAFWPLTSADPGVPQHQESRPLRGWGGGFSRQFTDKINSMPKFVASTTLEEPLEWNATLLKGDVVEEVQTLKEQPGRDLLIYGSGALVDTLMQHNLIDVYRLMLYPLALSAGRRFFREGNDMTTLTLTDATTTSTGVVVLTYEAAGGGAVVAS